MGLETGLMAAAGCDSPELWQRRLLLSLQKRYKPQITQTQPRAQQKPPCAAPYPPPCHTRGFKHLIPEMNEGLSREKMRKMKRGKKKKKRKKHVKKKNTTETARSEAGAGREPEAKQGPGPGARPAEGGRPLSLGGGLCRRRGPRRTGRGRGEARPGPALTSCGCQLSLLAGRRLRRPRQSPAPPTR